MLFFVGFISFFKLKKALSLIFLSKFFLCQSYFLSCYNILELEIKVSVFIWYLKLILCKWILGKIYYITFCVISTVNCLWNCFSEIDNVSIVFWINSRVFLIWFNCWFSSWWSFLDQFAVVIFMQCFQWWKFCRRGS